MAKQVVAGRYELLDRGNHSGASPFRQAFDLSLKRQVAVRIWPKDTDPKAIEVLASFKEPGIIHVYDACYSQDGIYLVTPELNGVQLSDLCRREGEFRLVSAIRIIRTVCKVAERISSMGWGIVSIRAEDILLSDEQKPTLTYAKMQRTDRETDSLEAIGQFMLKLLRFIDSSHLDESELEVLHAFGELADRALTLKNWKSPFHSLSEFSKEFQKVCGKQIQQEDDELYKENRISLTSSFASTNRDGIINRYRNSIRNGSLRSIGIASRIRFPKQFHLKNRLVKWLNLKSAVITAILAVVLFGVLHGVSSRLTMPDLHGQSAAEAKTRLMQMGWNGKWIILKQADAKMPEGAVLSESPNSGERIGKADTVTITVAVRGASQGGVPDFKGQTAAETYQKLIQMGVPASHIQIKQQSSSEASGTIIAQSPEAGSPIDAASTQIQLMVSLADAQALVPPVEDLSVQDAGNLLISQGLHYHYTIDQSGGTSGTVAQQDLAPGQVVSRGSYVELHVRK